MAQAIYTVGAGADVALAAATAKSVLGVRAGASFGLQLTQAGIAFDASGASAPTNEPVLIELCIATFASNAPGTASTTETVQQWSGRAMASGCTAASDWSSEPTVLTVIDEFLIHSQQGIKEPYSLGLEPDCDLNNGFVLRVTAPDVVRCRPSFRFARN